MAVVGGRPRTCRSGTLGRDEPSRVGLEHGRQDRVVGRAGLDQQATLPGPATRTDARAARASRPSACSAARYRGARSSWSKSRKATASARRTRCSTASVPITTRRRATPASPPAADLGDRLADQRARAPRGPGSRPAGGSSTSSLRRPGRRRPLGAAPRAAQQRRARAGPRRRRTARSGRASHRPRRPAGGTDRPG